MKEIALGLLCLIPVCIWAVITGISVEQDLFNTAQRPGVACFRIPALITAPNGDLVAAIDERVPSCNASLIRYTSVAGGANKTTTPLEFDK